MIVKILGGLDLIASVLFLMLIFGLDIPGRILFFCALLIFAKGLFILRGDVLSVLDLFAAIIMIIAIFFSLPSFLLWAPAFLLLAKGVVSFL